MPAGNNRQVRYLGAVAEEGQISRAAEKLNIGRGALSVAMAHLEAELGVPVLERKARGVALTPSGEAFLARAREAVELEDEAADLARSVARAARGVLTIGFIGPPPTLSSRELFEAFSAANPEAQVSFQDLPFPRGSTARWLAGVDAAICHRPAAEPSVTVEPLRVEARAVVTRSDHPLAGAQELSLARVLDETFVSYHADVQPEWAGFHSLDDVRGGPPPRMTDDRVQTTLQMLAVMASSPAITAVPLCDARIASEVMPTLTAIPLADAPPATVSLTWRTDNRNPLLDAIVAAVRSASSSGDGV
jgi:DNA-binding transcriptional LysR family regulator